MEQVAAEVAALVPGASEGGIRQALLATATRFCQRSQLWAVAREGVLDADRAVQAVQTPGAATLQVLDVRIGGRPRKVVDPSLVAIPEIPQGRVCYVELVGPTMAERLVAPSNAVPGDSATWIAVLRPLQWDALPDALASHYGNILVDGSLAWLFSQSTMPYHDPGRAFRHGTAFESATRIAGMARGRRLGGADPLPMLRFGGG